MQIIAIKLLTSEVTAGESLAGPVAGVSPGSELSVARVIWASVNGLAGSAARHFAVTDEIRRQLAFWRGNAAAVHRELVDAAKNGGPAGAEPVGAAARGGLRADGVVFA